MKNLHQILCAVALMALAACATVDIKTPVEERAVVAVTAYDEAGAIIAEYAPAGGIVHYDFGTDTISFQDENGTEIVLKSYRVRRK